MHGQPSRTQRTSHRTPPAGSALIELSREECVQLLRTRLVGRFAVALPGMAPVVVPVNYVVDDEVVVFRSGTGTKLAALQGMPVSFEIDEIDQFRRTGWSVLVQGRAYEATRWEIGHLDLPTWAPGDRGHWVRIVPETVTGRRITRMDGFTDLGGYL